MSGPESSEDPLRRFVRNHLRGRLAAGIVVFFHTKHSDVAHVREIAVELGQPPRLVKRKLLELASRGVLKQVGADTFNYAPTPEVKEQMGAFLEEWRDPGRRSRLMAFLDEIDGKDKSNGLWRRLLALFGRG